MSYALRPYQQKGLELLRLSLKQGHKRPLYFAATGSGKTLVTVEIIKNLLNNGKKVCLTVRRKQLVLQTKRNFQKHGINGSVLLNSQKGFDSTLPFQICSIDTVARRDVDFLKSFDFFLFEECHDCVSPKYQDFISNFQDKFLIGFTASPFKIGKKVHSTWDCVVKPIETHELRDQGFLTDAQVYVPTEINLDGIKTHSGDYAQGQLSEKMQEMKIVGDVVENYKLYGENKPAICFCVDKSHSMLIAEMFNREGIPAIHCDESTKQKDRDDAIKKMERGEIKILTNVNIFSTGVDIPCIEIALMARPTKSECLYIQQVGRALRPYRKCGKCQSSYDNSPACPVCGSREPSYIKESAKIIDFGNNTSRFGLPFDIRYAVIKEEKDEDQREKKIKLVKTCTKCFRVFDAKLAHCPNCGGAETKERIYKTESGELILYNEFETIKASFLYFCRMEIERRWKPNSKYFKLFEKYGPSCMKFKKEFKIPHWVPGIYQKNMEEKSGKLFK